MRRFNAAIAEVHQTSQRQICFSTVHLVYSAALVEQFTRRHWEAQMTIVFTAATSRFIVVTVDSAMTNTMNGPQTQLATKYYYADGIGCVATWGDLVANTIIRELRNRQRPVVPASFEELDECVENYLHRTYQSAQVVGDADDVGYHIAGFDQQGVARLYHRFWGAPRPNPDHAAQAIGYSNHSPSPERPLQLVYNGRNDIAETSIKLLINEIEAGRETRFDLATPVGLICLGNFVARMAGELIPTVGPPFSSILIGPGNRIQWIYRKTFQPVGRSQVESVVKRLYLPIDKEPRYRFQTVKDLDLHLPPAGTPLATDPQQPWTTAGTATALRLKNSDETASGHADTT